MNDDRELSPLLLAYLGDAVMEVLVRRFLVQHLPDSAACNRKALSFVTARSQSDAVRRLRPHFTPEEEALFVRSKNAKAPSVPRNVDLYSYRLATGLEALFGYHALRGEDRRNEELFSLAFSDEILKEIEKN